MSKLLKQIAACCISASLMITPTAKPISEKTATIGSIIGGVAVGALSGGLCHYALSQEGGWNNSPGSKALISLLVGAGLGGLTWYVLNQILYNYTPQGRINSARAIISGIENNPLIKSTRDNAQDITSRAALYHGTSWPLVLAREKLLTFTNSLDLAQGLVLNAENEIRTDPSVAYLETQCEDLHNRITELAAQIEERLDIIVNDQEYRFQVNHYEKHMEAERQREHEASLLHEKMTHESAEKYADRRHDSTEKDKDRLLKQNIINQTHDRPTNVNINI